MGTLSQPARIIGAALSCLVLSACANPWGDTPVEELPPTLRYAVAKPSRLVFGNYCGFGTRTGDLSARPVDRLDEVCFRHDSCYVDRRNHCDCDTALVAGAEAIRRDPDAPHEMRRRALLLVATFAMPFCLVFPEGVMPPRPRDRRTLGLQVVEAEAAR